MINNMNKNIIYNVSSKSHKSVYVDTDNNHIILMINLEDKRETENRVAVNIKTNEVVYENICAKLSTSLSEILENMLAYRMENTRLVLNIYLVQISSPFRLFMTIINNLSIILLKSGLPLKDVLCAFSSNEIQIAYFLHLNSIAYLNTERSNEKSDIVVEDVFKGIEFCIEQGEKIKKLIEDQIE